jgi:hypothetical protein
MKHYCTMFGLFLFLRLMVVDYPDYVVRTIIAAPFDGWYEVKQVYRNRP